MNTYENINVNTLRCLSMVNELAELIPNGIKPFSECNIKNKHNHIFYYDDNGEYKIVLDSCVDEQHHDIISNYDDYCNHTCEVRVMDPDDEPYIAISFLHEDDTLIIEPDGTWHMV